MFITSWTEIGLSGLTEKGKSMFGVSGLRLRDGATRLKKRHNLALRPSLLTALPSAGE